MVIFGFAFMFGHKESSQFKIGVTGKNDTQIFQEFMAIDAVDFISYASVDLALNKLLHHQLDMVIDVSHKGQYWVNDQSSSGYLIEQLLLSKLQVQLKKGAVSTKAPNYIDWLIPGILGMGMMFSGLFGVGYACGTLS